MIHLSLKDREEKDGKSPSTQQKTWTIESTDFIADNLLFIKSIQKVVNNEKGVWL